MKHKIVTVFEMRFILDLVISVIFNREKEVFYYCKTIAIFEIPLKLI